LWWKSVFFFAQPMLTGQDEDMYAKFKEVAEKSEPVQTP
jgi:hypothetical protein